MAEWLTPFAAFHLLRPAWLLLLLPSLLLLWRVLKQRQSDSAWSSVVEPELLAALQEESHKGSHKRNHTGQHNRLPVLLLFSFWLLALIALSGPTWERQPTPGWESESALVLLLDLSPSMAQDDLPPSRLERARFKLMDILQQRREGQTALLLFSEEPYLVTPLTDDVNTITNLLAAVDHTILPTQGDAAAPAIAMATQLLQQGSAKQGELLLLSDGVTDIADTLSAADRLQQQGYRLSLLGLQPTDTTSLESIAATAGGRYATLRADDRDIQYLLPKGAAPLQSSRQQQERVEHWVEAGVWLLLPIALLGALGFRRGWVVALLIITLPYPPRSEALEWADLWLRDDQQAARSLSSGDAAAAASRFQHDGWRGTALYQQGEYQAAAEAFTQSSDPEADYNRGNALAQAGQLEQAIEAYEEMLTLQPNHSHAQHNLQLVKRLLKQQQQQQQQQQSDDAAENSEQQQQHPPSDSSNQSANSSNSSTRPEEQEPTEGEAERNPGNASQADNSPEPEAESAAEDEERAPQAEKESEPSSDSENEQSVPSSTDDNPPPRSEAEMESEQWLRQIPQDPSGLLRRKFMLEHLYRKQQNRK